MKETYKHQIKRNIKNPLYSQLEDILLEYIESGEIKPGNAIPSERELCEIYGLSRMTVRKAIDRLVANGFLTRVGGKGTFVNEPKIIFQALSLDGLRKQAYGINHDFKSNLVTFERVLASGSILSNLEIEKDTATYKIERIFFADKNPIAMHTSFIPCNLAPGLEDKNIGSESLYSILKNEYKFEFHHASEMLESTLAKSKEALLLNIQHNLPMILLRITMFSSNNLPLEYVKVVFRGDKVRLSLDKQNI